MVGTYIDPDRGGALLAEAEAVGARTDAERTYLALFRAETLIRLGGVGRGARDARIAIPERPSHRLPGVLREREARPGPRGLRRRQSRRRRSLVAEREGTGGAAGGGRSPPRDPAAREPRRRARAGIVAPSPPSGPWSPGSSSPSPRRCSPGSARSTTGRSRSSGWPPRASRRRWRRGLAVGHRGRAPRGPAGRPGTILDAVGEKSDVRRLRALSRELKGAYRDPLLGSRPGPANGRPGLGRGPGSSDRSGRRPRDPGDGDAAQAPRSPLLPPEQARNVGHARPGPRRPVAGQRPRPGRELAPPDRLLPASGHRACLLGRSLARLSQPGHRADLARLRADREPQRALQGADARPRAPNRRSRPCSRSPASTAASSPSTSRTTTGPRCIATRSTPSTSR